jgi:hypothetical protein
VAKQSGHHLPPSSVEVKNVLTCSSVLRYAIVAQTTLSYLVNVANMPILINFTTIDVPVVIFTFGTMISLVTKFAIVRIVATVTRKCQTCFALRTFSDLLNIFLHLHFKQFPLRMMQAPHIACLINRSFQPCNGVDCLLRR